MCCRLPEGVPKLPEDVPKPPEEVPKPPEKVPKPPEKVPKPPEEVPKPPEGVPKPPVANQPYKCGEKGGGIITRILNPNSTFTHFSEYPWMLAILKNEVMPSGKVEKNMFQCGASLIHPKVALTAAHCVNV